MKNFVTVAAFAAGANALVGRSNSCCFSLNASGGASGTLGQLSDGQNRIGDDSLSPAQYCIDSNGAITDGNGRGCILTPPTTQLQCDEGATPTPGFSINSEGQLEYQGNTKFVACETGQNDGLNVYTEEGDDVTQCQDVTLAADSCSGSGSGSGSSSSASPSSPAPRPTSSVPVVSASTPAASSPAGSSPSGEAPVPSESASASPSSSQVVVPVSSAPGSSKPKTTVWNTVTSYDCSTTPGVPVETPSGPQSQTVPGTPSVPGGSQPSGTPGVPGVPGGSQPSVTTPVVPGGSQPSGTPSVPGGSQPSGPAGTTPGVPGGSQPSGPAGTTPSVPGGSQPSESVQPSGTSTGSQPSGSASGSCPTNLDGEYTAPHLIIPVDSSSPDNAPGTSYNGTISSDKTTLYNFDVPQSYADKTCSLVFLFPKQEDLETSAFTFSGDGKIDFASLESAVTTDTSYSNMPSVKEDYGVTTVAPGNSYVISTFSCPAGEAVSYEMKNSGSTYLDFFEDYNPSPLGLYITTC